MVSNAMTRPEWGTAKTVTAIFGISRSELYRLLAAGSVRSSSLRKRGQVKAKRLFNMDSVAAYIEAHEVKPTVAAADKEP